MEELVALLIEKNITIGSVESFTVGKFAAMLGEIPNVSKVYKGSLITYQNETKERLLTISNDIIAQKGVVSKEVASLMCIHGQKILNSDLCVSFTGNAGPNKIEEKAVGTVFIGIIWKQKVRVYNLQLTGTRVQIQEEAIAFVNKKIKEILLEENQSV